MEVDQEWVPYSQDASLYIRPTFIGTEVSSGPPSLPASCSLRFLLLTS